MMPSHGVVLEKNRISLVCLIHLGKFKVLVGQFTTRSNT